MEKYLLGTQRVTDSLSGVGSDRGASKTTADEAAKFGALLRNAAFGLAAKSLTMGDSQDNGIPARTERTEQPERSRSEKETKSSERDAPERAERPERPDRSDSRDDNRGADRARSDDQDTAPKDRKSADRDPQNSDDRGHQRGDTDRATDGGPSNVSDQGQNAERGATDASADTNTGDPTDTSEITGTSANIINSLIDGAETSTGPAVADKAAAPAQSADGKANATTGLNQAANQVADAGTKNQADAQAGQQGQGREQGKATPQAQQQPTQTAQPQQQMADPNAEQAAAPERLRQNTHASDTAKQAVQTAQNIGRSGDDLPAEALSVQAKQAQDLTKRTGGQQMKVDVEVNNEAGKVVSKPTTVAFGDTAADATAKANSKVANGQAAGQAQATTQAQQALAVNPANLQPNAQQGLQNAQGQLATGGPATQASPTAATATTGATPTGDTAQAPSGQSFQQQVQEQAKLAAKEAPKHAQHQRPALVDQINVRIDKMVQQNQDRINIQLRPASLGRIDVQLEVNADGRVQAVVTAETRNTMDLLQQDQRELVRALQQAGLNADQNSLSFKLRGEQGDGAQGGNGRGGQGDGEEGDAIDGTLADAMPERLDIITKDRIDVRV